jgi:hypothetical protein
MVTVRFATGLVLQYNDAHFLDRSAAGYTDIRPAQGGSLIAQVPTGLCVIEYTKPCRIYTAGQDESTVTEAFLDVLNDERQRTRLSTYSLAKIKHALQTFDARSHRWRT